MSCNTFEVGRVHLEAFKAPHRAVAGLRWVVKQGELSWRVPEAETTAFGTVGPSHSLHALCPPQED